MRRSPLAFLLLASCVSAHPSAPAKAPGRYVETFAFGGRTRRFILRVPKGYDGSRKVPIVMVLHGWSASADAAERYTRLADKGEQEGFVTIFPDGLGEIQGWNAGFIDLTGENGPDDIGFLTTVLDRVEKEIEVDRDREYVAGHSNGAFMANALGARLAGRLAAIASMAGAVGLRQNQKIPAPKAPLSVILLHGTGDAMVAYAPGAGALLQTVGAKASASFWAKADGCDPTPRTIRSADGKVTTELFTGGKDGTEVELVSVQGAPHDWWGGLGYRDGRVIDVPTYGAPAADLIWDFFKAHPRRG